MKRNRSEMTPVLIRASKRAGMLIEDMLREMHHGLRDPSKLESEAWVRLFGSKQSMVMNLQKLVQSLAVLNKPRVKKSTLTGDYPEVGMMSRQDMQILAAWLGEENAMPEA